MGRLSQVSRKVMKDAFVLHSKEENVLAIEVPFPGTGMGYGESIPLLHWLLHTINTNIIHMAWMGKTVVNSFHHRNSSS